MPGRHAGSPWAPARRNARIAAALFLSEATVTAHVSHLFTKLFVVNRVQPALHANRIDVSSP